MNELPGLIGNALGADACVPYGGGGGGSCSAGGGRAHLDNWMITGRSYTGVGPSPDTGPCSPYDCSGGRSCIPGSYGSLPLPGQNVCYSPGYGGPFTPCYHYQP